MTARTRALVQRPGRKQHLASLGVGDTAWVLVCNGADVPVFGADTTARDDWAAALAAASRDDGRMCRRCRTALLVAALAAADAVRPTDQDALLAEIRDLRAQVAAWTTAALDGERQHATFLAEHHTFRRAARS